MTYNFTLGSRVEVRSDDEGFKGAYYTASVLEESKSWEQYVVVYDQLTESEDPNSKHLTEMVHITQLRPLPPVNKDEIIKVHDSVDAYYNEGWWAGEVVETLQDGKFLVYFSDPSDQQIVERNHLRHHLEWGNGEWEKPGKKSQIYKMITQGSEVEVAFERENYNAWHLGNVLHVDGKNKFLVKYQCLVEDNGPAYMTEIVDFRCIRPLPPRLEEQDFVVLDKVDVYYNLCWWSGVIHKILDDMRYVVITANIKLICTRSYLRPRLDWIDDKWATTSPNTKVLTDYNEPLKSKRAKTLGGKPEAGKYCGAVGKKNDALGTLCETPVKKNRKRQLRDQYKESIEGSSGIKRTQNREGRRPQKLSLKNQIGNDNLMLMTVNDEPVEDNSMLSHKDHMNLIASEREILTRLCKSNKLLNNTAQLSTGEDQLNKTRASTSTRKFPNESLSDMIPNTYLDEDQVGKGWLIEWHGETSKTTDNESQNQGLTTNIPMAEDQEIQTVARNGATTKGKEKMNTNVESVSKAQGYELGTSSAIVSCKGRDNSENVPFIKSSPLWKSLESMEIFSKTQRKPHFNPLLKCRDETREGLAIAHMVTFLNVVEKTSNLRFSDPSRVIVNSLKSLAELENHGFDVEPVQARLRILLSKKETEKKLQEDYEMIEKEITNNVLEQDKLSQEIIQIKQTMTELAEKLTEIDTKMVSKDKEIATLRSRQEAIRKNLHGIEQEF